MRGLPNMKVMYPSDDLQTKWAVEEAAKINGPVYIRLCRLATPVIYDNQNFEFGKAVMHGNGTDATIFVTGDMTYIALQAKEELEKQGKAIRVVDFHTIKPIDREMIIKCAKETPKLISIEDHSIIGGLGTAIAEVLTEEYPVKLIRLGVCDVFGKSGKPQELLDYFGLSVEKIKKIILDMDN